MGLAAEQDTYLLDAFRCLILSEEDEIDADILQVYPGQHQSDPPIHFVMLLNENPDFTSRGKAAASEAIEKLVWPHSDNLVRLYFKHVHPVYPIVSKGRFLHAYASLKMRIPASLRGAVYALACIFWHRDPSLNSPCPVQQWELVDHAHEALRREQENLSLFTLQACLLLHHVSAPAIDSIETSSMWTLSCQATAISQMLGLHHHPGLWNIAPWEKRLRKKMWWAVYWADCWSSVCHGNPSHISPTSFNTLPPDLDDAMADEDVPENLRHLIEPEDPTLKTAIGARFLEMTKIALILREILDRGL